jgi:hypothetical protein
MNRGGTFLRLPVAIGFLASLAWIELVRADSMPTELVGVWSVPDAVFEGDNIRGGDVLYLLKDGKAGLVGAPLPVMKCAGSWCAPIIGISGKASYEAATRRVTLNLQSEGKGIAIVGEYDATTKTITLRLPAKEAKFMRRKNSVPPEVEKVLSGVQSSGEKAK